jgi:hypothetical protein
MAFYNSKEALNAMLRAVTQKRLVNAPCSNGSTIDAIVVADLSDFRSHQRHLIL